MREKLTKLFGSHLVNLDMVPEDAVIIDAGACVGAFITDIRKHVKEPAIFALEPNKKNILELKKIGNIVVIEAALVGKKESKEMRFYEIKGFSEWGNVTGLYTNKKHTEYIVDTVNLKDLLQMIPPETIHYLKMDIEGSEWDVVNDMNLDTFRRIEQISIEIHTHPLKITKKLEDLGYRILFEKGELYAVREGL